MRIPILLLLAAASLMAACASGRLPAPRAAKPEPRVTDPEDEAIEPELSSADELLANRAFEVIRDNCWGCHGEPGKKAYGETAPLDWILDYDKLIETKTVIPGNAGKSRLIYITGVMGKMPREFDEDGLPSIEGELSEQDLQSLIDWIKADAPRWAVVSD